MPLIRDYTDSLLVDALTDKAEILFARLLTKLDGNGNYTADPTLIKAYIFPRKNYRTADIERWLNELATLRRIDPSKKPTALLRLYSVSGKKYLHMVNYGQKLKWKKSTYPPPEVEIEDEVEVEENLKQEGARSFFSISGTLYWGTVSDWFRKHLQIFLEGWEMKNGEDKVARVFAVLDTEYLGYSFNDENHVQRTFISISNRGNNNYGATKNKQVIPGGGGFGDL